VRLDSLTVSGRSGATTGVSNLKHFSTAAPPENGHPPKKSRAPRMLAKMGRACVLGPLLIKLYRPTLALMPKPKPSTQATDGYSRVTWDLYRSPSGETWAGRGATNCVPTIAGRFGSRTACCEIASASV
jgi:hypothetical protein